jgi:uncharacterized UPF0160 family protein
MLVVNIQERRIKMKRIVTHDGVFHTDEVVATAMLKICFNIEEVIRTRDEKIISKYKNDENTFVLDVGGEYNPAKNNFDHHQIAFECRNTKTGILYSTAGLIWDIFGLKLIKAIVPDINDYYCYIIHAKMYNDIISVIDASDNGDFKSKNDILFSNKNAINLTNIVPIFNLQWDDDTENYKQEENRAFNEAVDMCMNIIKRYIEAEYSRAKADEYVYNQIKKAKPEDEILILDKFAPWKKAYAKYNNSIAEGGCNLRVVIYPNKENTQYIAESIKSPDGTDKFLFPKQLRGQPKEELIKLTGYKSIEFVHRTGFLAVFNDKKELIEFVKSLL